MKKQAARAFLWNLLTVLTAHAQTDTLLALRYGDFDRYVLALTWQTGFCQEQHERKHSQSTECRLLKNEQDKRNFLTVHGLWPGLPKSIAAQGVDEIRWIRYGCATRPAPDMPEVRASQKCSAAETGLSLESAAKLSKTMPAAGGDSCLERYEYAKHGVCFRFNPDAYFGTMVRLNTEIKYSPLGNFLAQHYGKTVSRNAFEEAIAQAFGTQNIKAFKLICHGNPTFLTEIQISLKAAAINTPLSATSFLPQPHPGSCNKKFRLDAIGY